jgi:transcriptional regulator with XRE-family HTH domain
MENWIRELRKALGLNQIDFGRLISRSLQSVRNYEMGQKVPPEIERLLKKIAAENGIALNSASPHLQQRTPPHLKNEPPQKTSRRHSDWHDMLDEVLDSELPEAITAVESNLLLFSKYVRGKQPQRKKKAV